MSLDSKSIDAALDTDDSKSGHSSGSHHNNHHGSHHNNHHDSHSTPSQRGSLAVASDNELSSCGVGFIAQTDGKRSHNTVQRALRALRAVEHRGALGADGRTSDGAGIMAEIPFALFGYQPGSMAVATLFLPSDQTLRERAQKVLKETFHFLGLRFLEWRQVPTQPSVLGPQALQSMPSIQQVVIRRPPYCRTDDSFQTRLYMAKQMARTRLRETDLERQVFFVSLSAHTITYKGLVSSKDLPRFYPDLWEAGFKSRFALFHRRFSTNTRTAWDKAQPFRLVAHNGEINTIAGNRSWSYAREQDLGLPVDELLTHHHTSDSGSLNEMVEALRYRSSIGQLDQILAIMMPPAQSHTLPFFQFWGRAMEPWDGPALVAYCDGHRVGARLDRNGFRPCRFAQTDDALYLASEAGIFGIDPSSIRAKGNLGAGCEIHVDLVSGKVQQGSAPSHSTHHSPHHAVLSHRLCDSSRLPKLDPIEPKRDVPPSWHYVLSQEELDKIVLPMIQDGKEPIGSMGDTAALAILSDQPRSFFDYFFQRFSQVTNPPLDYLRESMVTDLTCVLGARPNIFSPKEMLPPPAALVFQSPILDEDEMEGIFSLEQSLEDEESPGALSSHTLHAVFEGAAGADGIRIKLAALADEALEATRNGASILILTDSHASSSHPPIPILLALRAVVNALNKWGLRLDASVVAHTGAVRTPHHLAAMISFGATAVCPFWVFRIASDGAHRKLKNMPHAKRMANIRQALTLGLLKIMSKIGISVCASYQSAKLFTAVGLGAEIIETYFPGLPIPIGGLDLESLTENICDAINQASDALPKGLQTYQHKEHPRGKMGEIHSMTAARARLLQKVAQSQDVDIQPQSPWGIYRQDLDNSPPSALRHLLDIVAAPQPLPTTHVASLDAITSRFFSGGMSFGAINAEFQRDLFAAMHTLGGGSNSGEGGDNPYTKSGDVAPSIKQIASGRFGVTAQYLAHAHEFEIKIAQGAKPGEGGQLMGLKVNDEIAQARHATPGVTLISPPPLHDIYSIEDLKQLIYELKQFRPTARVAVKLVAGADIGTIAVGVAKAHADVIHISGGDGGTGAAPITSMRHAGLPWELGLAEVHNTLLVQGLRKRVILRVDGGLASGRDVVVAALLGAEEFGFGKLLLVAMGCIMARICEKNTCPTGIATHDPRFKSKYKGSPAHVVSILRHVAAEVREDLSKMGVADLSRLVGRNDLLRTHAKHRQRIQQRHLDLDLLLHRKTPASQDFPWQNERSHGEDLTQKSTDIGALNANIISWAKKNIQEKGELPISSWPIHSTDRAVPARLIGALYGDDLAIKPQDIGENIAWPMHFCGSAGQGFATFLAAPLALHLEGEANDSVAKSMSGGSLVIVSPKDSSFIAEDHTIVGNCALYGATGGEAFIHGHAGDRFAVRNSGACAVVEGVGLHACEYMTGGWVIVLGPTGANVGAGMTGGTLILHKSQADHVHADFLQQVPWSEVMTQKLSMLLESHIKHTQSGSATRCLADPTNLGGLIAFVPKAQAQAASFRHASPCSPAA